MRNNPILPLLLLPALCWGTPVDEFIATAKTKHAEPGEKAAKYLADYMPAKDIETLSTEFLTSNLDLSFTARAEFPRKFSSMTFCPTRFSMKRGTHGGRIF